MTRTVGFMEEGLRIKLVADIHHGRKTETKRGPFALSLLENFVKDANACDADLVVDLGDRISDEGCAGDRRRQKDVGALFEKLTMPRRHILGNHDVVHLTPRENEEILGSPLAMHSIDLKGFHLVFWNANTYIPRPFPSSGALRSDLEWLRADLEKSDAPAVIFTHFPLYKPTMWGNYYFEDAIEYSFDANAERIREIITSTGNVIACIAGHVHWNSWHSADDIAFITLQSLTESFCTPGVPSAVWGTVELGDSLSFSTVGRQPMHLQLPLRHCKNRWIRGDLRLRSRQTAGLTPAVWDRWSNSPISAALIDLDGVVWRGNVPVDGALEAIKTLQEHQIPLLFVTNNALLTREDYAEKLRAMGILCTPDDFLTAGYAAAQWLRKSAPRSGAFILGGRALREEFREMGIREDREGDFVVAAMDEEITGKDLIEAVRAIEAGARLLVVNPDLRVPVEEGYRADGGALMAFLESTTERRSSVVGKPSRILFEAALERLGASCQNAVMIGDTEDTDIAGAQSAGIRAIRITNGEGERTMAWRSCRDLQAAIGVLLGHNARCADKSTEEVVSGTSDTTKCTRRRVD